MNETRTERTIELNDHCWALIDEVCSQIEYLTPSKVFEAIVIGMLMEDDHEGKATAPPAALDSLGILFGKNHG